ncbi:MAG: hypothetical protein RL076_1524 [Chloroflexota bacterium]|jgi:glycosyltransferase involved in cell wall biosynthesis
MQDDTPTAKHASHPGICYDCSMTLHIAVNGFFWDKPTVGVGQYLHGLVNAIQHIDAVRITLIVPADTQPPTPPQGVTIHRVATPFDGRARNVAKLWFEQIAVPQAAQLLGAHLLHVPYFAAPYVSKIPVITTIPDLIPLTRPAYRGSLLVRAYMALVARAAQRSTAFIAISHHVAHEAHRILSIPLHQITVTHLAADPMYTAHTGAVDVLATHGITGPYIYYVGGYDERKNVGTIIRAFASLPDTIKRHTWLVLAGQPAGTNPHLFPDISSEITIHGIDAMVKRVHVSRAQAAAFYSAATVFVYPSLAEGFGLPPLEAMACGTPVIVSNAASLPEVVGTAALSVPPDDVLAWRDALATLLTDASKRQHLAAAGMHRASRFSYDTTAMQTVALYAQVAAQVL